MEGIFEFKGKVPKGMKDRFKIRDVDKVIGMNIKNGDTLRLKGIGDFKVVLSIKGTSMYWLDVE